MINIISMGAIDSVKMKAMPSIWNYKTENKSTQTLDLQMKWLIQERKFCIHLRTNQVLWR